MTPETVDLRYVEISLAQLAAKVNVDDAQLKAYYDEQKAKTPERFSQPEQRRVSHILLTVANPKDDAAVKAKAEGILKRAQAGEDFAKLAKEFSQDPGSAQQGGDLGWSERKAWVAPFADAAFSMKVDEIRGPVKTQFGYHILKLVGIQPASVKTFEQSRADLETDYRRTQAEKLFNDAQDALADAALQNTTDIDEVAHKAGLTVLDIPAFSRSDGGGALGKVPAVIDAAFSQDVLDGRLSPIVEVEKGRGVVLRATDHKLPQQKPLDAVRTEVVGRLEEAARHRACRGGGGRRRQALAGRRILGRGGEESGPGRWSRPSSLRATDQQVPLEIRTTAFGEPKPAGKPLYSDARLDNGDAAVIALERGARGARAIRATRTRTCAGSMPRKSPRARRRAMPPARGPMPR